MNATIEAARAADVGMGFAIVSDEVKSLSSDSQKSIENIRTIIGNLQVMSQLITKALETPTYEVTPRNTAVSETLIFIIFVSLVLSIIREICLTLLKRKNTHFALGLSVGFPTWFRIVIFRSLRVFLNFHSTMQYTICDIQGISSFYYCFRIKNYETHSAT